MPDEYDDIVVDDEPEEEPYMNGRTRRRPYSMIGETE